MPNRTIAALLAGTALAFAFAPVATAETQATTTQAQATAAAGSARAPSRQAVEEARQRRDFYWQCVTFARMLSGIQIFGDAWTWWEKATGRYARGDTPEAGAVMVFQPTGRMSRGHVAVVSKVLTDRVIQITHANWSPIEGRRGRVEEDVTVVDVSPNGDWSRVKVWYDPLGDMGSTVYPTYGFIYQAAVEAGRQIAGTDAQRQGGATTQPAQTQARR